jgi:Ca2+-binding RTX toxin-like protein
VIVEAAAGGTDLVQVAIALVGGTYTLGAQVENATLTNTVAFNLTGNAVANTLTGNTANNLLDGGAGVDSLIGLAGNDTYNVDLTTAGALQDTVTEAANAGTDTIVLRGLSTNTAASTITIGANVEALDASATGNSFLNLTGNALVNTITGNTRANVITGGALGDTMNGLDGGDIYLVASTGDYTGDVINDTGPSGIDEFRFTATAASTLTLTASTIGLERAVIGTGTAATAVTTGTTAISLNASAVGNGLTITGNDGNNTLTGTSFNDVLEGNRGSDTLVGNGGADRLFGGLGNDTLTGGAGTDSFIFNTATNATTNRDTITDFNVVDDTIQLENAIFTALGAATGTLAVGAFVIGTAARDAADRIVYNSGTGALFYDNNGNAAGGSVQIATLTTGLALTNNDFLII